MQRRAGPIMDVKVEGLRSGKVLGIGELLASACYAGSIIDILPSYEGARLEQRY